MKKVIESLSALNAPPHILAALELFQFHEPAEDRLALLSETEQQRFFTWCDIRQLTLALPHVGGAPVLPWVLDPVKERAARYELRFQQLKRQLFEIAEALDLASLEFVMLKGLSHAPALTPDARLRAQGDIDLWLRGSSVYEAQNVLTRLGYRPLLGSKARHLAPMGRPGSWKWRGDLFDPEMPISVELHYELWSEQTEYITAPDVQQFWERRRRCDFDGRLINVLCDEDLLGFAALHLLLHLLHGDLPLQRAWEIARFLDAHVSDALFWTSWRASHPAGLKQLEVSVFHLVTKWFQPRSNQELLADFQRLPPTVKLWLERYYLAPLAREWAPNKLEILLHFAFLTDSKDRVRVLFRRLTPMSVPLFGGSAQAQRQFAVIRLLTLIRLRVVSRRLVYHLITFLPTLFDGIRWLLLCKSSGDRLVLPAAYSLALSSSHRCNEDQLTRNR